MGTRDLQGTFAAPPRNRFYGVWSYGRDTKKMFKTQAEAKTFDGNRFTDAAYGGTCSGTSGNTCRLVDVTQAKVTFDPNNPLTMSTGCQAGVPAGTACAATVEDPGWFYEYGVRCPLKDCGGETGWNDEKTGSGAGGGGNACVTWGGFRPSGMTTTTDPCSGEIGTPVTYGYVAHAITGTPTTSCGYGEAGVVHRAAKRSTTAPPTGPTMRVTLNAKGEIQYSALQIDAGAAPANKAIGTRKQAAEPVYWLEVPRQLHECRHEAATSCK
jgi:type IV pilus assembly protein PilY1